MTHYDHQHVAANGSDLPRPDADDVLDEVYESLLISLDAGLASGSTVALPDETNIPRGMAEALRKARDCLALLHAAARAGKLDDLTPCSEAIADLKHSDEPPLLREIGRFSIIRELGRGGYGLVFLAVDSRLGRQVALKVPRPEALITADLRRRFVREAEAAGGLTHPNLITLYEAGEDGPLCYLATEYCPGPTLAQWLQRHGGPAPPDAAARLIAEVADGVAHAHARGVLHRDIKPSNVLLEPHVVPVVEQAPVRELSEYTAKLTDFGLAKLLERHDDETRSGMLLGTPSYMAPEQATGRLRDVCAATDVYGLGVVLHELLTGCPAFKGQSDADTLRQVCLDEAPHVRNSRADVSRDLEAIVLKCLEKSPAQRYATADELARDLRRYLAHEPTLARPTTLLERAAKWSRRRPAAAALVVVCLLAAFLLSAGGWFATIRTRAALDLAEDRRVHAESSELEMRRLLYASELSRSMVAWEANDPRQARRLLEKQIPRNGQLDLREFAWRYAWRATHEEEQVLAGHASDVHCVRYSPDGQILATAGKDHEVRLWDAESGQLITILKGHTGEVTAVAFTRNGDKVISSGEDGKLLLWDVAKRELEREILQDDRELFCLAVSTDGSLLAAGGIGTAVQLWQVADWKRLPDVTGPWHTVYDVAFSPDGSRVATASDDGPIRVWDVRTAKQVAELTGHRSAVRAVTFLPDGKRCISAGREDARVRVWDVPDLVGDEIHRVAASRSMPPHHAWLYAVAPCRDGRSILVATLDGAVRRINLETGETQHAFNGHEGRVWSMAISPDGQHVATCGEDKTVRIWPLAAGAAHQRFDLPGRSADVYLPEDGPPRVVLTSRSQVRVSDLDGKNAIEPASIVERLSGDFDGDGRKDECQYVAGEWTIILTSASENPVRQLRLGGPDHMPVVGDWNGDGRDDIGAFHAGWFYLDTDGQGEPAEVSHLIGGAFDLPVIGDWNGDGCTDLGCYFDRQVQLFCKPAEKEPTHRLHLLEEPSKIVVCDWDGDGANEIGYFTAEGLKIDLCLSGGPPEYAQNRPTAALVATGDDAGRYSFGQLDFSYGHQGRGERLLLGNDVRPRATTADSGGNVIIAGRFYAPAFGHGMFAARWNTEGDLDPAFGNNGVVFCRQGFMALDVETQQDDKVLLAGYRDRGGEGSQGIVARFLPQGEADKLFGNQDAGTIEYAGEGISLFAAVAVQPDAKIVLAGSWQEREGDPRVLVMRLLGDDGALDQSFGQDGSARFSLKGVSSTASALAIQSDGRILVAGHLNRGENQHMMVLRLDDSGHLDASYGDHGVCEFTAADTSCSARNIKLLPDGALLVLGESQQGPRPSFTFARLTRDGALDSRFGNRGTGYAEAPQAATLLPDEPLAPVRLFHGLATTVQGQIYLTGRIESHRGWLSVIARYNADGTLDNTFGYAGLMQKGIISDHNTIGPLIAGSDGTLTLVGLYPGGVKPALDVVRLRPKPVSRSLEWADVGSLQTVLESAWSDSSLCDNAAACVAVAPNAGVLAVAFPGQGVVRVQDLQTGKELTSWSMPEFVTVDAALSDDGSLLALASDQGAIQVWNVKDRRMIASLAATDDARRTLCFTHAGDRLAFRTEPSSGINIWNCDSSAPSGFEQSMKETCHALAFSPDDRLLATSSGRVVKIWNSRNGTLLHSLSGHGRLLTAITFSPDGRTLATAAEDGTIKLWDMQTYELLLTLREQKSPARRLHFRRNGKELVSTGDLSNGWSDFHVWYGENIPTRAHVVEGPEQ